MSSRPTNMNLGNITHTFTYEGNQAHIVSESMEELTTIGLEQEKQMQAQSNQRQNDIMQRVSDPRLHMNDRNTNILKENNEIKEMKLKSIGNRGKKKNGSEFMFTWKLK